MLDDVIFWIMLNTLGLITLLVVILFGFAWAYSEIQHLRAKKDCLHTENKNKIFGGYKK